MLLTRSNFIKLSTAGLATALVAPNALTAIAAEATPAADVADPADAADAAAYVPGEAIALSDPDYDFQAEYFFSDYNAQSNADVDRQGGIDTFTDHDIHFKGLYYDELLYLLEQEGNYLILLGGSWCHNTRAEIGYINEFAKKHGVDTVYNFDLRLDGATRPTHIRETAATPELGDENVPAADWNYLYGELIDRYLPNLNDWVEYKEDSESALTWYDKDYTEETIAKVQVPFLFLYNKDNTTRYLPVYDADGKQVGVEEDAAAPKGTYPIVYGFEEMVDLDAQGIYTTERDADGKETGRTYFTDEFLARLEGVFDFADDQNITFNTYTDAQYLVDAFVAGNGRGHSEKSFDVFAAGAQINIEVLNYRQTEWLLQQPGSSVIVFAGAWCANTQAVIGPINDYAVADGVKVYFFDFRLDGKAPIDFWGYDRDRQFMIRATNQEGNAEDLPQSTFVGQPNPFAYLYTDLIGTYLTNVETTTDPSKDNYFITAVDEDGKEVKAARLQQPYLLSYNKDALDEDGFVAPVLAWHEQMLEITEASHERGSYAYQEDNYASYTAGIEAVLQAYDQTVGKEYTAYDGEPRQELEPAVEKTEDAEKPADAVEKPEGAADEKAQDDAAKK